jgi:hypothetical protein
LGTNGGERYLEENAWVATGRDKEEEKNKKKNGREKEKREGKKRKRREKEIKRSYIIYF